MKNKKKVTIYCFHDWIKESCETENDKYRRCRWCGDRWNRNENDEFVCEPKVPKSYFYI
jgi:hypothetical protein